MVDFRTVLKGIATTTAVTAATLTGGPAAGASMATFLASPSGQRLLDAAITESARQNNVQLEDLAHGGLVTRPTLGLTGEAGPELVIPMSSSIIKPKRKRSRTARAADKKLSKAFKEANRRMRTKSGKLRKGKTQGDVARLAHRLKKKM